MTDRDLLDALTRAADHLSAKPYDVPALRLAEDLRRIVSEREAQFAKLLAFMRRSQVDADGNLNVDLDSDHRSDDNALLDYIGGDALRAAWDRRDRWYA